MFYRMSCVARVPSSSQHKILLVEFSDSSFVSVKELNWQPGYSAGLGSYTSNSFVGSCTFSAPYLIGDTSCQGYFDSSTEVYERAYLTMLSSNGSIMWFGEDCSGFALKPGVQSQKIGTSTDIYMFEDSSIINVSDSDQLKFAGDCIGNDHRAAKRKLSLSNSEFISSPSRDGCTLTARLDSNPEIGSSVKNLNISNLAIVAVRVLVGSMPDLIPREISIVGSGRTIKTKRNMKRWYDFVLTDEEILLVIRNGFVTMHFSSSHDMTSGAVVDAVEVYVRSRSDLPFLEQVENKPTSSVCNYLRGQMEVTKEQQDRISCVKSITVLAKILGQDQSDLEGIRDVVQQILEKTSLGPDDKEPTKDTLRASALSLLHQIERDDTERSLFVGKSTLRGLMATLADLDKFVKSEVPNKETTMIHALDVVDHIIMTGSNIARANKDNYQTAMLNLIQDGTSKSSLALEAKRIIDYGKGTALDYELICIMFISHTWISWSNLSRRQWHY